MKKIIVLAAAIFSISSLYGQVVNEAPEIYVISHLNEKLPSKTNILYTPTIRAAWTLLKEQIIGDDIILTKPLSLTASLNNNPFHAPDNHDWLAMAGFVENGILEDITINMQDKFGISNTNLNSYTDDNGIICYSYMHITAGFGKVFETLQWDFTDENGCRTVECFGVSKGSGKEKNAIREQVRIHDYRHRDDFIVKISSVDPQKEIILAKVPFGGTLFGMIRDINDRISLPGESKLEETDELVIPKIKLEIEHSYNEILGLHLKNKGFEEYFFDRMSQDISLKLDESGAEAIATGEIILKKGPGSRLYIFDKPFLIIIRDKNSEEPDMVVWVNNTGILKTAKREYLSSLMIRK